MEIRDRSGETTVRAWSGEEIEHSLAWLKRMNARGSDIHVRPAGEHGLVLVDGLKMEAIERMKREGFAPAATVEASPGSFQAWVKLSEGALSADVRRVAAQKLAEHYEGSPSSAGGWPSGRLAGFTNQDPQHTRDGRQPYVLAHDCLGRAATAAAALVKLIEQGLDQAAAREERQRRLDALRTAEPKYVGSDPVREYRRQARRHLARFSFQTDYAPMDETIATDMAKGGRFTLEDIDQSIREASPNVESCKAGHMQDYARRMAERAWAAPDVQQYRLEQVKERQMQRGRNKLDRSR